MKNKIFHTQDLCLRTNLRCPEELLHHLPYSNLTVLLKNHLTMEAAHKGFEAYLPTHHKMNM